MRQIGFAVLALLWATPVNSAPAAETAKNLTAVDHGIKVIHNLDEEECVPRLICEMAVSAKLSPLSREESSILSIFRPLLDVDDAGMAAPLKIYRTAAAAGNEPDASDASCVRLFKKCPFDGQQLRSAFKAIHTPQL